MEVQLTDQELQALARTVHAGAAEASRALAMWLETPSLVEFDSVDQVPLSDAAELLGSADETLCFCIMATTGTLTGQLILAFDEESGLSLSDLLLNRPVGTATSWGELEQSAALETANIVGCAHLNAIAAGLSKSSNEPLELIPTPPTFQREFAASLLESVFMPQAMAYDTVISTRARFELRGERVNWNLLFVPDETSVKRIRELTSEVQ